MARPLKYSDPIEFQNMINQYFIDCDNNGKPYVITALCLYLGTTRETLREYELRSEFVDAIKIAKERVANYCAELCLTARNPAGAIFMAKNHGFTDKQEITLDANITQTIKPILDD